MADPWEADPLANSPSSQSDVRKMDDYFAERDATLSKLSATRKLGSREKDLAKHVYLSPQELAWDEANDRSPENLALLMKQIAGEKNLKARQILLEEQGRLTYTNMLGTK